MQSNSLIFLITIASGSFLNLMPESDFAKRGFGRKNSLERRSGYANSVVNLPDEQNEPKFDSDLFNHMFSEGFR